MLRPIGLALRAYPIQSEPLFLFCPKVQFELPASWAAFLQASKFQCAEFGNSGLQVDRDELAGFAAEHRLDRSDFFEFVIVKSIVDHVADPIFTTNGRREKPERGRFTN